MVTRNIKKRGRSWKHLLSVRASNFVILILNKMLLVIWITSWKHFASPLFFLLAVIGSSYRLLWLSELDLCPVLHPLSLDISVTVRLFYIFLKGELGIGNLLFVVSLFVLLTCDQSFFHCIPFGYFRCILDSFAFQLPSFNCH